MEDRIVQFRVGIVVVATVLIAGLLTALVADRSAFSFKRQYPIKINLEQAPGVLPGTPVRRSGVLVGRVEEVELTDDGVTVTAQIDGDRKIRTDELCVVKSNFFGDAVLAFVPGRERGKGYLQPGQSVRGEVQRNPLDVLANLEENLTQTIESLGNAGIEVADLASKINKIIDDADTDRIQAMLNQTEQALMSFTTTMDSLNEILGDEQLQAQLREGIGQLPKLIKDASATMDSVRLAVVNANENLENLKGLTEPLGENGEQIVKNLESAAGNLDALLAEVAKFTESINSSDGTVGQLIHNRELYDNVNSVVVEIEYLARKLRPIVDDVRAFTYKIALDPSRLGVRGAIERRQPIK